MRAFVSVDLPGPSGPTLREARAPAHFTLLFLAELAEERAGPLAMAIGGRAAHEAPFRVAFGPVDAFPERARPRVVFLSVVGGGEGLERLARLVRGAADEVGVRYDARPFVPHLTLFRVRNPRDAERARSLLDGGLVGGPAPFVVDALLLKESRLGAAGATHTVRSRCPLAAEGGSR